MKSKNNLIKILALIIFNTITNNIVYSQAQEIDKTEAELLYNLEYYLNKNNSKENNIEYNKIAGSPYIYEDFKKGNVFFKNGESFLNCMINYNAYDNEMEFKIKSELYTVKNPEDILRVEVNDDVFLYKCFTYNKQVEKGLLMQIVNDKISLFKKESIEFIAAKDAINTYEDKKPAQFKKRQSQYYIGLSDGSIFLINNKRELLKKMTVYSDLKLFMKKEKINLKSEEDIIRLIKYLNEKEYTLL